MTTSAIRKSVLDVYLNGDLLTTFTYEGGYITGTPLLSPIVISLGDAAIKRSLFRTFRNEIVSLYNPVRVPSLGFTKHEITTPSGKLKLEVKVGTPIQMENVVTYDSATKMITVTPRSNFEVTFGQWGYWLDAIDDFGRLIGRFE